MQTTKLALIKSNTTGVYELTPDTCLDDIKEYVVEKEQLESGDDVLLYAVGHPLVYDEQLSELQDGCQIDVCFRLLGGKVHGSLARAGKVKGQTPKVEKQEKKRKKCGRARRRILYQKRFINVVNAQGGKRRGPNSNA